MRTFSAAGLALFLACGGALAADLKIGTASEVTTLDPHFFHLTSNTEIHKGLYSGLITQDADMNIVPDLATTWRTIVATHREFKLRPGVVFHDGTPLTADDIVFTYERARNVPNAPGSFLQYLKHVTKTTAAYPLTVIVAQAYDIALGKDVAAIPILFQITAWGMRKGLSYGGFPQDATVAALVHMMK